MKNIRFITYSIIIIIVLLIIIIGHNILLNNNKERNDKYVFTNKIYSSFPNDKDDTYGSIMIFMSDGKYFKFTNTHDEGALLRSVYGSWQKKENDTMFVKYSKAIYYKGGELVETDESNYFNLRRINYSLIKKNYPYDTTWKFIVNNDENNSNYKNHLIINDATYYPIYESDKEEDLYEKLEKMYGQVYIMLVDDSIESINNTTDSSENT